MLIHISNLMPISSLTRCQYRSSVFLLSTFCFQVNVLSYSSNSCKRKIINLLSARTQGNSFVRHSTRTTHSSRKAFFNSMLSDNIKQACVPCSSLDKSHLLNADAILKNIENDFPLWKLIETEINNKPVQLISRSFTAKNFQCALDCINAMGAIAEEEQHHPNFHLVNYRDVEIELYTHKLGGVTENDFVLAKRLDTNVKVAYSPKWLKEHPEANSTVYSD